MTKLHMRTTVKLVRLPSMVDGWDARTRVDPRPNLRGAAPDRAPLSDSFARVPSDPSSFTTKAQGQQQSELQLKEKMEDIRTRLSKKRAAVNNVGKRMIRPLSSILRQLEGTADPNGVPPPFPEKSFSKAEAVRKETAKKEGKPSRRRLPAIERGGSLPQLSGGFPRAESLPEEGARKFRTVQLRW
ncbi:hypothetical protein T484DRAFT_1744986 [Baffinella frigidus]|nr:hypothetical protein T484DRAFT_1744986 [Cryptophyta sp. CCMP2293]|eukprot:CAMPEP_0180289046 /NCGR_PEP_ID=MMETSP0988-20121125/14466_1 /TAXON_ID=697907 /ORGANISM="non described non described, Strain CCMP2293" /LENGTH=185 /DNA_ID=CAMNT_0022263951 /DNA_START=65 /DNA_END=622 /DNA_ORIENTATION=+